MKNYVWSRKKNCFLNAHTNFSAEKKKSQTKSLSSIQNSIESINMKNHKIMFIFLGMKYTVRSFFAFARSLVGEESTWNSFIVMLHKALKEDWWLERSPDRARL